MSIKYPDDHYKKSMIYTPKSEEFIQYITIDGITAQTITLPQQYFVDTPKVYTVTLPQPQAGQILTVTIDEQKAEEFRKQLYKTLKNITERWRTPIIDSGCEHDWKSYEGFTEKYNYCSKCDEKDKL